MDFAVLLFENEEEISIEETLLKNTIFKTDKQAARIMIIKIA